MNSLVLFFLDVKTWFFLGFVACVLLWLCDHEASKSGKKLVFRGSRSMKERGWVTSALAVLLMPISLLLAIIWLGQLAVSGSEQQKPKP
jgi:hypothetical protein